LPLKLSPTTGTLATSSNWSVQLPSAVTCRNWPPLEMSITTVASVTGPISLNGKSSGCNP
jgi:hypothetical protein